MLLEESNRMLALADVSWSKTTKLKVALTVDVPSISKARVIMVLTCFSTAADSTGSVLWYIIASWKLPSPRWPTIDENRPRSFRPFVEVSVLCKLKTGH
jgi:hypothetical protein